MHYDELSLEFLTGLFEGKKEKQIAECVFEGLDDLKIIEKLLESEKESTKK